MQHWVAIQYGACMRAIRKSLPLVLGPCFLLWVFTLSLSLGQQNSSSTHAKAIREPGRTAYNSTCAGCHGLDGRGSDKAVDISGSERARHLSDTELSGIISNGVPGTGMPAFHNLTASQTRAVVAYLRLLQGKTETRTLPGNAKRGKEIFFGKGECSSCHTISGAGGFLGPDLSGYGATAPSKAIRDEIVKSQRLAPQGYRAGVITTNAGERLEGLIRNEDNFSIQFQTKDGAFHFLQKSDLRSFNRLDASLMPTNYGERLSSGELDDLVSYLMTSSSNASDTRNPRKDEWDDDTQ